MSALTLAVRDYLALRRALGFKLERTGQLLGEFAAWSDGHGIEVVSVDAAVTWATQPADADPGWWGTRLAAVRGFARWQSAFDPRTEVPPADVLPTRSRRADPFPYTDADIDALMVAARAIPHPLKAATYETLVGLLAVTGMRVGEAIGLDRTDVGRDDAVLVVRGAKFNKTREVVLHPSAADALRAYASVRDHHVPRPATPAFFVSTTGTRLIYNNVHRQWLRLINTAGLEPRTPRCRPRPHDLRHRFAVTTLIRWYADGADVEARLPQLSTYLGHVAPDTTYWYLRAAPELLALAAARLEAAEAQP